MANLRTDNLCGEGGRNAISGSVFFDGESYLTASHATDFDLNADNFTIEYWFLESDRNRSERRVLYLYDSYQSFIVGHTNDNGGQIFFSAHDSSNNLISGSIVTTSSNSLSDNDMNQWMHVAIVREGSNLKIYLNGVLEVTDTGYSTTAVRSDQNTLYIGKDPVTSGREFKGYLSNLRICKGHAVYTSNFTPPYEQLEKHFIANDDLTSLLCCQDSDNPLQEATGKTITGFGRYADSSVELVTNGGPTTDVTGWTAYNSSVAYDTGQIKVTRSGGSGFSAYATITNAVIGQRYKLSGQIRSANSRCDLYVTTAVASGTLLVLYGTASATVDVSGEFTATATTLYVFSAIDGDGHIGYYNRVSVKAADYGDAPKVIPSYGVDAGNTFNGAISMNSPSYMYFPTGKTEERGRGRALFAGGYAVPQASAIKEIYYSQIQSTGTVIDFGELTVDRWIPSSGASSTRGLFTGGGTPSRSNIIDFVTIATTANATDFGDLIAIRTYHAGFSNSTRLVTGGGNNGSNNLDSIEYVTIASTGDATDFGDITTATSEIGGDCSPTRGLFMGGTQAPTRVNIVEFVTIATTGNAQDFGDFTTATGGGAALSSNTRLLYGGGDAPSYTNTIEYFTIATTGDATNFGDLTVARGSLYGGTSNKIRGVFVAGFKSPGTNINAIDHVTIATTGNASDFGDLVYRTRGATATSDSHGGLS